VVGPTQDRLLALAKELGVPTYKTYNTGDNVYCRDGSLSRYASTGPLGPIPPDGSPGVILGFIEGQEARRWTQEPADKRRAAVIESFARYFGDRARKPTAYVDMSWTEEEWTRGRYGGFTPPGVLVAYGEHIRKPFGRIHWAGTETAAIWNGYMDGALRSGERAAHEVLG
jgi:monoamine oxidase